MANIRTHPYEWERMLELLDIPKLSDEQSEEVNELKALFSDKSRCHKSQQENARSKSKKRELFVINEKGVVIHRTESVVDFVNSTEYSNSFVYKALKNEMPLKFGQYKGFRLVRGELKYA